MILIFQGTIKDINEILSDSTIKPCIQHTMKFRDILIIYLRNIKRSEKVKTYVSLKYDNFLISEEMLFGVDRTPKPNKDYIPINAPEGYLKDF
jgi:hypothetical protein